MRGFVKGLSIVVLVLLLLAVIGISATIGWRPFLGPQTRALTDRKFEATPERLKRGTYVAEHLAACVDCHTPFETTPGSSENMLHKKASGQIFPIPNFPGTLVAANITPDNETGVGKWTDDELARAIREGVDRQGHTLFPMMPYSHYRGMSDEDIASVVVYLRSLPAIRNPLPATVVNFPVKYLVRNAPEPVTGEVHPDISTELNRGQYLVLMAACSDCHTPIKRGRPAHDLEFAGGRVFDEPTGKVASPNITPDPTTGIGNYTEETFIKALRTGYVGTRQLNPLMPWQFYNGLTDEDTKAMYAYVKTVKPIVHRVDNSKPSTTCKKCGEVHGAGDAN
jgi:mono/diheme cytochrome c family protein